MENMVDAEKAALRREWNAGGVALQREYGDFDTFAAYRAHESAGHVRILDRSPRAGARTVGAGGRSAAGLKAAGSDDAEFVAALTTGFGASKATRETLPLLRSLFRRDRARFDSFVRSLPMLGTAALGEVELRAAVLKADWNGDAKLRAEFGDDWEAYAAFRRHEADVDIVGARG